MNNRGSALVVVLAMVVLLTALVVAFFSRALLEQQISTSSANQVKVELFTRGVVGVIESELRQSLEATGTVIGGVRYYRVASGAAEGVTPPRESLKGLTNSEAFPNLVAMSSAKYPLHVTGSVRAAERASTTGTSLNGRSVPLSAWNKPLLLPKARPASGDSTRAGGRAAPDWILVARDGSNPAAHGPGVVGRYAFMIYNEGGLLDANLAGAPVLADSGSQRARWSRKGTAAFADWSLLKTADGDAVLTRRDLEQLVGWRNYASVQPGGNFPQFTVSGDAMVGRWLDYVTGGRFTVSGTMVGGRSDQMFSSRRQLIQFLTEGVAERDSDKARLQNALQYLGTFSRSSNQPSFWPHPGRPKIRSGQPEMMGGKVKDGEEDYGGGNSAHGEEERYNPPFPTLRVTTALAGSGARRADGSPFIVGEALVKKRFALARLMWLTYQGPSAGVPESDALFKWYRDNGGMPLDELRRWWRTGTSENIYNYFGLTWVPDATSGYAGYWRYDHGITGQDWVNGTEVTVIGVLSEVRDKNREPDFFELLQAAVNVGSVAKGRGAEGVGGSMYSGYLLRDTNVEFQIWQMGLNIIDGANPTQYPTCLKVNYGDETPVGGGKTYLRAFYGAMDLPYHYGTVKTAFISRSAEPPVPDDGSVSVGTLTDRGRVAGLLVPVIWNPYDASGSMSAMRPAQLRVSIAGSALYSSGTRIYEGKMKLRFRAFASKYEGTNAEGQEQWGDQNIKDDVWKPYEENFHWERNNTGLTFVNNPALYREPTALCVYQKPAGSELQPAPGNVFFSGEDDRGVREEFSGLGMLGFLFGRSPQRAEDLSSMTLVGKPPKPAYRIYSLNRVEYDRPSEGLVLRLEYQPESGGRWVPYQEYFFAMDSMETHVGLKADPYGTEKEDNRAKFPSFFDPLNQSLWNGRSYTYSNYEGRQGRGPVRFIGRYPVDPRVERFGMPSLYYAPVFQTAGDPVVASQRPGADEDSFTAAGYGGSNGNGEKQGWRYTGNSVSVFNPSLGHNEGIGGYHAGGQSQNLQHPVKNPGADASQTHYADADGVVRRAMGGWVGSPTPGVADGLPMATGANARPHGKPIILHRPYRTVAELGTVFRGTPWKNIDFSFPESGDSALLDIFCIRDEEAVAVGKVDLNTRQTPVLAALLAGAYRDEFNAGNEGGAASNLTVSEAENIAALLVTRTRAKPLVNISDLVGYYDPAVTLSGTRNNFESYDGFSADLGVYTGGAVSINNMATRFRETAIRALSGAGQAGTWNLLIDVIAQTGRYPAGAGSPDDFIVEGESRQWVHVAIDRLTGKIIDQQIEQAE
ncbi:MAG: hypothetical protein LBD30_06415 [Verrucomicrobiales bacterium]|jgi:hypothetical protein|nr:hypothetical protein [Verrucomicrobiales bacterium]